MATITSLGVGSGLDINSIVSQLVALERRPLQAMQSAATALNTQVSSWAKLKSLFSGLQDASSKLNANALWSQSVATSSDETAVGTVSGGNAVAGNYAVTVQALASTQTLASGTVFAAATDLVGSGTLTFTLGKWNALQTALTPKAGATPVSVVATAADTVQSLRDKINASGAGVTASIITDATGVRLSLNSSNSGADNGFGITAADSDLNNIDALGLSRLAYDPPTGANGMQYKKAAANAEATVNGIAVVSASNELTGSIEGLTLRLRKVTATPVDIAASVDRAGVNTTVKAFADAYNELARYITEQTRFDPTSQVGGPLQGDSTVGGLQSRLRAVLNADSGASSTFPRLSNVGLQLQRDGTLQINQSKLDSALGNLTELKKAFSNTDNGVPANHGFTRRYENLAAQVLALDGSLTTRTDSLRQQITKNSANQARVNDRADRYQQQLVRQYTALDGNLARLNSINSFVTQQLTALNGSGGR